MSHLPTGTLLYLDDKRTGKITGTNEWGQYEVYPSEPTYEEFVRNARHLIRFEDARPVPRPGQPNT